MKAAETRASNFRRVAGVTMVLRLLAPRSVTGELYHRSGAFVLEGAPRPGRRLEGARAEAERQDVRDPAELLQVVLAEGRRPAPQEEPAAGLADAQQQARFEPAFDLLRVLGFGRFDAGHLAQSRPLRLRSGLDRPRPELALVLEVVADPVGGDDPDDLGREVGDQRLDGLLLPQHGGHAFEHGSLVPAEESRVQSTSTGPAAGW